MKKPTTDKNRNNEEIRPKVWICEGPTLIKLEIVGNGESHVHRNLRFNEIQRITESKITYENLVLNVRQSK